jgi:hypothetical protein
MKHKKLIKDGKWYYLWEDLIFFISVTTSKMFFGKRSSRSRLEIFFKIYGFFFSVEGAVKI